MKIRSKLNKLLLLLLFFVIGVSLFACKKASEKIPYGDLKNDKFVFEASYKDKRYMVSEIDLYNEFRRQTADTLTQLVEAKSLAAYVGKIDVNLADHRSFLVKHLNKTIFGADDVEKLKHQDAATLYNALMRFVASHNYPSDYKIAELKKELIIIIDQDSTARNFNYEDAKFNDLLKLGQLNLAKKLYAKDELLKVIDKKKDKNYINPEKDYLTKFKTTAKNNYDVSFFAIDFISDNELNNILQDIIPGKPIKISGNGDWYFIPDIRTNELVTKIHTPEYKYLEDFLKEFIKTKKKYATVDDIIGVGKVDPEDFSSYITQYKIDPNRNGQHSDEQISKGDHNKKQILEIMVKAYNKIHDRSEDKIKLEGSTLNDFQIKYLDDRLYKTRYTKEEMQKHLLKDEVYNTLKFAYKENNELNTDKSKIVLERLTKVYGNSDGGGRKYLIFKFSEDRAALNEIFDYDKNEFKDPKDNEALKAKIKAKEEEMRKLIIEDKLTDSFVEEQFKTYLKEKGLAVFDPLQRISFAQKNVDYSNKYLFKDNNTIARINETDITVREFFNEMLLKVGINLATSKIYNEIVSVIYADKVTASDKNAIYKALKTDLSNFSQGYNRKYNAQIGRNLYLQHAYGVTTFDEAVKKGYADKAKEYFAKAMPDNVENYYQNLAKISGDVYKKTFSMKVQHLLFSVDDNLDGTPDNPATLSDIRRNEVESAIRLLTVKLKEEETKGLKDLYKNFEKVIADYVLATRYVKTLADFGGDIAKYDEYKKTPDYIFGTLKKAGVSIKKEEIKDPITQKSFTQFDKVFFDRCQYLYNQFKDNNEFPRADLIHEYGFSLNSVRSSFGWHQIIIDSIEKPKTARTTKEYTSKVKINDVALVVPKNEQDTVSMEQVKTYLNEVNGKYDVLIENKEGIQFQLSPVLERLNTGGEFGIILLFHILKSKGGTYQVHADASNIFEQFKETSINKFNDYAWRIQEDGTKKIYNKHYCKLWTNWDDATQSFTNDFLADLGINPFA